MVSSESQEKTFLSTVTPDFGHFGERKTRQMAEGIEAAGSNTEAVSPSSVPRDEEKSDIRKAKECQSLDFGFLCSQVGSRGWQS